MSWRRSASPAPWPTASIRRRSSGELTAIAIIAPPKALGEIRKELSVKAQSKVVGELAKDLTRHPLKDIEKALTRG